MLCITLNGINESFILRGEDDNWRKDCEPSWMYLIQVYLQHVCIYSVRVQWSVILIRPQMFIVTYTAFTENLPNGQLMLEAILIKKIYSYVYK